MTMENVLAAHELAQLDKTVISNAVHYLRFCRTVKETVDALESSNRYLAKCRDTHPDKFIMMATCVPGGGDECLKELKRAVKQDEARAVIINSSHQGHYPDEDAAKPFFKLVCDLDIPVAESILARGSNLAHPDLLAQRGRPRAPPGSSRRIFTSSALPGKGARS